MRAGGPITKVVVDPTIAATIREMFVYSTSNESQISQTLHVPLDIVEVVVDGRNMDDEDDE